MIPLHYMRRGYVCMVSQSPPFPGAGGLATQRWRRSWSDGLQLAASRQKSQTQLDAASYKIVQTFLGFSKMPVASLASFCG